MKQVDDDPQYANINKRWFKNRMRAGLFQHKVIQICTDDYLYDAKNNFQKTEEWEDTPARFIDDYALEGRWTWVYGPRDGEFRVTVNMNSQYLFRLKPKENKT